MRRNCFFTCVFLLITIHASAQKVTREKVDQFVDFTGTIGESQGTAAASYVYNWRLGKKRKLELGLGARWTSYFGKEKDFITDPAKLARSTTTPFVIVFSGQETQNWDTLTIHHSFINSINISFNAAYEFFHNFYGGLNIDLVGFSFGERASGVLVSNGQTTIEPSAKPTTFNVLLTGDNDYGSLNSEFFLKYKLSEKWGVKAAYGFYFAEYKTNTVKQTAPDGTIVDRFRNKVNTLGLGIAYHF
jgi:hypothetical protein